MTLKLIKNHKTLSEWFNDLPIKTKVEAYNFVQSLIPVFVPDIFVGDPPPTDVGTIPLDSTGIDLHTEWKS